MRDGDEERRVALGRRITETLAKVEVRAGRLRRTNARLIYTSLVASAAATAVAGLAAASGPVVGQGPAAWRVTCGAVALLTALAGLFTGLQTRSEIPERLARAVACAGKLRSLEIALTVGGRELVEVVREYEEVTAGYQDCIIDT